MTVFCSSLFCNVLVFIRSNIELYHEGVFWGVEYADVPALDSPHLHHIKVNYFIRDNGRLGQECLNRKSYALDYISFYSDLGINFSLAHPAQFVPEPLLLTPLGNISSSNQSLEQHTLIPSHLISDHSELGTTAIWSVDSSPWHLPIECVHQVLVHLLWVELIHITPSTTEEVIEVKFVEHNWGGGLGGVEGESHNFSLVARHDDRVLQLGQEAHIVGLDLFDDDGDVEGGAGSDEPVLQQAGEGGTVADGGRHQGDGTLDYLVVVAKCEITSTLRFGLEFYLWGLGFGFFCLYLEDKDHCLVGHYGETHLLLSALRRHQRNLLLSIRINKSTRWLNNFSVFVDDPVY